MGDLEILLLLVFIGLFVTVLYRWDKKLKRKAFLAAKREYDRELREGDAGLTKTLKDRPKNK